MNTVAHAVSAKPLIVSNACLEAGPDGSARFVKVAFGQIADATDRLLRGERLYTFTHYAGSDDYETDFDVWARSAEEAWTIARDYSAGFGMALKLEGVR